VTIAATGCGSDELNSSTATKLKALATLYLDYAVAKRGQGPSSEQVLKNHMRSLPDFVLQMNGVGSEGIDAVFVSDRDQEPFVVLYGVTISGLSGTSAPLLAYEKTGKKGKRLVVFANTKVAHVDESQLPGLMSSKP
jgi:hypothetical protein